MTQKFEQHTESNVSSLSFRNHTALLLATALPFLQPAYRQPVELMTKFLEFSETIKLFQESQTRKDDSIIHLFRNILNFDKESGLFGFLNTVFLDLEGMLESLGKVCTGREKEILSMFLNIIRAKNFYETYGDILQTMLSSDMFQTTPESQAAPEFGTFTNDSGNELNDTLTLLKTLLEAE